MKFSSCPFGPALRREREKRGVSQWDVAVFSKCHVRNVQRIEAGQHEPGVMAAIRLAMAAGADVGAFFQGLAASGGERIPAGAAGNSGPSPPDDPAVRHMRSVRCPFGPLLRHYRLQWHVSQQELARKISYNLRNMITVEKGDQEPGIMAALGLVAGMPIEISLFFDELRRIDENRAQTAVTRAPRPANSRAADDPVLP